MALQKPGQSALAVRDDFLKEVKTKGQPEKKKVLDEDTYTEVCLNKDIKVGPQIKSLSTLNVSFIAVL